jgi:hypothetical protein
VGCLFAEAPNDRSPTRYAADEGSLSWGRRRLKVVELRAECEEVGVLVGREQNHEVPRAELPLVAARPDRGVATATCERRGSEA